MGMHLAVLDLAQLTEIGDPEFLREMVDFFEATAGPHIDSMAAALAAGDGKELARVAHALRGSSLGMFATTMADLSGLLEAAGKAAKLESAHAALSLLRDAYLDTVAQMRELAS